MRAITAFSASEAAAAQARSWTRAWRVVLPSVSEAVAGEDGGDEEEEEEEEENARDAEMWADSDRMKYSLEKVLWLLFEDCREVAPTDRAPIVRRMDEPTRGGTRRRICRMRYCSILCGCLGVVVVKRGLEGDVIASSIPLLPSFSPREE